MKKTKQSISLESAAKILGISEDQLRIMAVAEKLIKYHKTVYTGQIRFFLDDLQKFQKKNK